MALSPAVIRDSPQSTGDADWVDVVDNWRDADATWLQERCIVRVATTPEAETNLANTHEGRVFYSIANKVLYISTLGVAPFAKVWSSSDLHIDETSPGSVIVGINGHESSGIVFNTADGSVSVGDLVLTDVFATSLDVDSIITGTLEVNGSTGITINTDGAHTTHITTGVSGLTLDSSLAVSGFVRGSQAEFSSQAVTGVSDLATVTVSDTVMVAVSVISPLVRATTSSDLTVTVQSGKAIRFTAPTIGDANFYYGGGTSIRMGWVVVSSSDPGVTNVPEGTIWVTP